MKKLLLKSFLFLGVILTSVAAWAQPVVNYAGNTSANNYTFTVNSVIASQTPTNTGTSVGAYATVTNFAALTSSPNGVIYDPVSSQFYAIDYIEGYLYKISTGGSPATTNTGNIPVNVTSGIVVDGLGNIFISDKTRIQEYNAAGTLQNTITGFTYTYGLTVDGSNNIFVADGGAGSIIKLTAGTFAKTTIVTGLTTPYGITANLATGDLYVSQNTAGTNNVIKITNGVNGGTVTSTYATGFNSPRNLSIDASGNVYVADNGNNAIKKIVALNTVVTLLSTGLSQPRMVTFDPSGNLYEADYASGYIKRSAGTYYTYTGTIAPGLTLNPITGVITGTPITAGNYSIAVTAASPSGNSAAVTVNFTIVKAPALSYASTSYSLANGAASSTIPIINGGSAIVGNYILAIISGALPTGITFDNTTGTFTCTPTAAGTVTFKVSGTNSAGTGTTASTIITVTTPPSPNLSYTGTPYTTYVAGVTNTTVTITNGTGGGAVTSAYALNITSGALPNGITFSTATGTFTVVPTVVGTFTGTVTASNSGGPSVAPISMTVSNPPAPSLSYTGTPYTFLVGAASTNINITNATGAGAVTSSYVFTPTSGALPTGITFSTATGTFTAAPTAVGTVTGDVVASNAGGPSSAHIVITVNPKAPVLSYTGTPFLYASGSTIAAITISNSGGAVSSAYVFTPTSGALPGGVTFNSVNGTFSFTTSTTAGTVTGDVVASNVTSSSSAHIVITIADPPVFTYASTAVAPYYATRGLAFNLPATIISGGPITTWTASALPAGTVTINSSGVIGGTPNTVSGSTLYVITGKNAAGVSSTYNVYIAVVAATTLTYANPPAYVIGQPITTLSPTGSAVPITNATVSPALPSGLSMDNAGNITGTPTLVSASQVYTVTGTASNKGTASGTVTLQVIGPPSIAYVPNSYAFAVNTAISPIDPTNSGSAVPASPAYGPGTVILTATNGLKNPWGITTDPAGNVYAVNYTTSTVTKYSTAGVASPFITSLPSLNPIGIVFDSFNNAYVLTATGLYKYNSSGVYVSTVVFTGITGASGVAIDDANNLYVSSSTGSNVKKYAITGGAGSVIINAVGAYRVTGGVAVDSNGLVYVVDNYGTPSIDAYTQAGAVVGVFAFASAAYGVAIDAGNNVYVAGSNAVTVFDQYENQIALLGGLNDPRGVVTDNSGNLYVSDYANNTVTEYKPVSGYFLNGTLPPGLLFDDSTGEFTGTPTTLFPATTLTVTAYNAAGSSSTNITFTCGNPNYWIGRNAANPDWNTGSNWSTGTVPLSTDIAYIGTNSAKASRFTVIPNISAGENPVIAAVVMGSSNWSNLAAGITATGTGVLNVTNTITYQSDYYSNSGYTATLSGTGTIKANSLIIASNYNTFLSYTQQLTSSINNLVLSGPLSLINSSDNSGDYFNSVFNVTGGITSVGGIVKTTNIASTSSIAKITVTNGTLQLANTTAFSGLSSNGLNTFVLNNTGATVEYSGAAQTVYTDKTVTGLPTGVSYKNIKFSGTGAKTPNAGNLNVTGDFTNIMANDASNYVTLTAMPVFFNGTTQALAGGAGTGTTFKNVTFSGAGTKTMASGTFNVISTGLLTMSGNSTSTILAAGTPSVAYLTLQSDVNGTATVPSFTGPSITGYVNVQRFITGGAGYRGYRLLSSPVYTSNASGNNIISLNYPITSVYLKGTVGIPGGFDDGGNPNLFLFRENLVPSNTSFTSGNFRGVNNISTPGSYNLDGESGAFNVPVGDGFMMFFRGDRTQATLAVESATNYMPTNTTLTAVGILNQGPVTVKDWYTPTSGNLGFTSISGDPTVTGFNLVGNPYPSSIDWDKYSTSAGTGITAPGIGPFMYLLDSKSSNYNVYQAGSASKAGTIATTASNIIPSGQGFFVVAGSTTASLTFSEAAKTNAQATAAIGNLFMGTPPVANTGQYMRLMLAKDSIHVDGIVINFNSTAKAGYVFGEDAPYKLGNGPVSLASTSADNVGLAINTLPLPTGTQVIKLQVGAATDGVYTLALKEIASVPAIYDVWLKDAYKKDSLDIKHNPSYAFDVIKSDTASFGVNRFSLIIRQNSSLGLNLLSFTGSKITAGTQVVWKTENEQNYTNFTVERSVDNGKSFQVVGGFSSTGAGAYSFIDKAPVTTVNDQYRLKLVDLNSKVTYSSIVIIQYAPNSNNIAKNGMTIYPNPAIGTINVSINQTIPNPSYQIQIVNNLGTIVKTAMSTNTAWQDDVSRMVPGTYIIKVINNANKTEVGKGTFVKL